MSKFNINYLNKDELEFELKIRGLNVTDNSVANLRSELRKNLEKPVDLNSLSGKLSLKAEFESISTKIEMLKLLQEEVTNEKSMLGISKLYSKVRHVQGRISILEKFKMSDLEKDSLSKFKSSLEKLTVDSDDLNKSVDQTKLAEIEDHLNKSFEEEDLVTERLLSTVNLSNNPKTDEGLKSDVISRPSGRVVEKEPNPISLCEPNVGLSENENVNLPCMLPSVRQESVVSNLFTKINNPVEMYIKNFEATLTNGLIVNDLLKFLKNLVKIKCETSLSDSDIYQVIINFTEGPLRNKILEARNSSLSLDQMHKNILTAFIPTLLRERMKQDLVLRPQKNSEPLSVYLQEVKLYNVVLKTEMVESDLVEIISQGLNPEERGRIVFYNQPKTFYDLEQLCINVQNVRYVDHVRNQCYSTVSRPNSNSQRYVRNSVGPMNFDNQIRKCYICNRPGHVAKYCYRRERTYNLKN